MFVARHSRFLAVAALVLVAAVSRGDDKTILQSAGGTAQVVIIMDNSAVSATKLADSGGFVGAYGGADTPDAKMAVAKNVLLTFLNPPPGSSQWAVATFDRGNNSWSVTKKEFIYAQGPNLGGCDFDCAQPYAQRDGAWERWGPNAWPFQDPDPGPNGGLSRQIIQGFGQYPIAGDVMIQCSQEDPTCTAKRVKMVWKAGNHYHLIACEGQSYIPASACPAILNSNNGSNGVYDQIVVTKIQQHKQGNNWQDDDTRLDVVYNYVQSFVATGSLHGIDDHGSPQNNCGSWETGPNTCPSVGFPAPYGACAAGTLARLKQELEPVANLVDINPATRAVFYCNGPFDQNGTNTGQNNYSDIEPLLKECVDNTLGQKGLAGYYGNVPRNVCNKRYAIFITDDLQANQQTDPCSLSHAAGDLQAQGVQVFSIYLGTAAAANAGQGWWKCLPQVTGAAAIAPPGWFIASDTAALLEILHAIASRIDENSKDFASATVSSVQTGTTQMAMLATFNASVKRSIWSGRLDGYVLNAQGYIDTNATKTITDPNTQQQITLHNVPNNDPAFLKWNAGVNLEKTSALTILGANQAASVASYLDDSTDITTTIPTYAWPGRRILYSMEAFPGSSTFNVPERTAELVTPASFPPAAGSCVDDTCDWYRLKVHYMGLTIGQDTFAAQDVRFIRGDRNSTITALGTVPGVCLFGRDAVGACIVPTPGSFNAYLYNDYGLSNNGTFRGEEKLGDVFHSNPTVIGRPNNFIFYLAALNPDGVHDYVTFFKRLRRRRQVLFAGANDGLLHAFDVGAFRRATNLTTCPDGTNAASGNNPDGTANPFGGCYDLGLGSEIFAYAPRATMISFDALTRSLAFTGPTPEWTADGLTTADDVFVANTSTALNNRDWRTVLVGSLREGARNYTDGLGRQGLRGSYFALDITQPDSLPPFDPANPDPNSPSPYTGLSTTNPNHSPQCLSPVGIQTITTPGCAQDSSGSATAYPRVLWEFNDTTTNAVPDSATNPPADLDGATDPGRAYPDLGETWSKPLIGRIELPADGGETNKNNPHICRIGSGNCEDKYVAIFGGGFDSDRKERRGNWIYVVDVETGAVLFKTNAGKANAAATVIPFGSIASQPLGLDYDFDGYLDVVYFGDLMGRMWRLKINCDPAKVSFSNPSNRLPVSATGPISATGASNGDPWKPFLFFNDNRASDAALPAVNNVCGGAPPVYNYCNALSFDCPTHPCAATLAGPPRSIYYSPTAVFQSSASNGLPVFGIGFATGERDDILGTNGSAPGSNYQKYRFFYVVDDPNATTTTYIPTNLTPINPTIDPATGNVSFSGGSCPGLTGYYINLPGNLYTDASGSTMVGERGISDVIAVNSYIYFASFTPQKQGQVVVNGQTLCSQTGIARLYRIYYQYCNNGVPDATGENIGGFASNPVAYVDNTGQIHVIDATDQGQIHNDDLRNDVRARVKNWKEQ